MAKLRKTRAQKEITTEKRNTLTYSFDPTSVVHSQHNKPMQKMSTTTTTYVKGDLQKTVFTSLLLIIMQVVLLFLLQHHIIKIPGATY